MTNPFLPTRYELDRNAPIWRSAASQQLEQRRSIYVIGTRGTGKTSLFRSIYWADILRGRVPEPSWLSGDSDWLLIGLYIRPPLLQMSALDNAPFSDNLNDDDFTTTNNIRFEVFTYLIASSALCDLFSAVSALRGAGYLSHSPKHEELFVKDYITRHPDLLKFNKRNGDIIDFVSLSGLFEDIFDNFRIRITRGQTRTLINNIPQILGNDLLHRTTSQLTSFIHDRLDVEDIRVRICIDDCEAFTRVQQRYLNSLVRDQRSNIFWTLAYVDHNFDAVAVNQKAQSLSDADRIIIDLNNQSFDQFSAFCNEVTRLRIGKSRSDKTEIKPGPVSTDLLSAILGNTSVNGMFYRLISQSRNSSVKDFSKRASAFSRRYRSHFRAQDPLADTEIETHDGRHDLYYQCYLYEQLLAGGQFSDRFALQLPDSPWFRRKMRAALLHFSRRYELSRIPYFGWQSIVSLSDRCVRDYLETMAAIIEDVGPARIRSGRGPLSPETQRKACERSSRQKFDSIREIIDDENRHVTVLVQFLGRLTAQLQSDPSTVDALKTPERGVFSINYQQYLDASRGNDELAASRVGAVRKLVSRAENGGFLRMIIPDEHVGLPMDRRPVGVDRFTLHQRFAPLFGFSYRGPYEAVSLPIEPLIEIYEDPDSFSVDKWVDSVSSNIISGTGNQYIIPFGGRS